VIAPRLLMLAFLLFLTVIGLQYVSKIRHSEHDSRSALLRWRPQLLELQDGVDIWAKYAYPNPPMMALILLPIEQLPPLTGAILWFCLKAAMAVLAILVVSSMLDAGETPFPTLGKAIAVGLSLRPIEGDLVHGNVNLFILLLLALSLSAYCRRKDTLAGILLGLSIACKVTPGLFILYFLWKRAWKTLLGTALGLGVFVLLVPALALGWAENLTYLQSWHRQMVAPYAAGVVSSEHKNQSLPGLLHRLLSDEPSFSTYVGEEKVTLQTHNLASLPPETVQGIIIGCMALFGLLAMASCRTPTESRRGVLLVAEFGFVILGMLLFCERTWKHHCVILLIPFSVIAYAVTTAEVSRRLRWCLAGGLIAAGVLMLSTSSGHLDAQVEAQGRLGKLAQVYGAYVWMFLILLVCLVAMLCGPKLAFHFRWLRIRCLQDRLGREPTCPPTQPQLQP
jgi:hypothetical protein